MNDASIEWTAQHLGAGANARIEGPGAAARLAELASSLIDCAVIRVTAPPGGLGLSGLIGQLSGRASFDDQDDAALEIGFRRLAGVDTPEQRTVLLLDALHGVQRPVLRYLQQVIRNAPRLSLVIAAGPELEPMLAEPGLARLRDRLGTVVHADAAPPAAMPAPSLPAIAPPRPALTLVPAAAPPAALSAVAIPADWTLEAAPSRRASRRRALAWTTAGVGMVASAMAGAWLGQHTEADPGGRFAAADPVRLAPARTAEFGAPPVSSRPPAVLALAEAPAPARVPHVQAQAPVPPAVAEAVRATVIAAAEAAPALVSGPALAAAAAAEPWTSWMPPTAVPSAPDGAALGAAEGGHSAPPATTPARAAPERGRAEVARARTWAGWRYASGRTRYWGRTEAAQRAAAEERIAAEDRGIPNYGAEELPPEEPFASPPRRGIYAMARDRVQAFRPLPNPAVDQPFIGTFSTDPYGQRVFRYGR